jgi:hypothetical protein
MPSQVYTYPFSPQEAPESENRAQAPCRIKESSRYLFKSLKILDRIRTDEQQNLYQRVDYVLKACVMTAACFMPLKPVKKEA